MTQQILLPCGFLALCAVSLVVAKSIIARAAKGKTYSNPQLIPRRRVGLVLGCSKHTAGGRSNPFFENRIAAAAELYHQRKVEYLLVSGGMRAHGYNEPTDMKNALMDKGVPADRILMDCAGHRTLDSIIRAKETFRQDRLTIISQNFHNERAIFLAGHLGIDAIGFDAPEVAFRYSYKTRCRERV